MVGGGQGCWVKGGGAIIFLFSRGGGGARNIIILCVFQFIPTSSGKKKLKPNSFVCLPIHSYVFPPKRSLNPNSFVCLQIHSYIFQKNTASQFLRLYSNSFVCLPIHSYVFSAGMVGGGRGWWVEGGGAIIFIYFFSGGRGARNIIILCVFQCIRMSSNSFVCLRKKLKPNSFVCLPIHWGGSPPRTRIIISRFIRMSSNSWDWMGVPPPEPLYIIISRK